MTRAPRPAYAGIGARATPSDVLALMTRIAYRLEREGYVLRSGGADGADSAFERGVQSPDNAEIYLPKPRFNGNASPLHSFDAETERAAMAIAAAHHPKFVVCWTADGKASGGTGQALRVASAYDVPIFNLFDPSAEWALAEFALKDTAVAVRDNP